MTKRKVFTPEERRLIWEKTDGYCAYCGQSIPKLIDMQVDHVVPIHLGGTNDFDNLLPSCRSCNRYKSTLTLEKFRESIEHIPKTKEHDSSYRLGRRFGVIEDHPEKKVIFYFETLEERSI